MHFSRILKTVSMCSAVALLLLTMQSVSGFTIASASNAEEEEEDYNGILVNEPGADVTYAYCAGCHSERIIAQQGLTRDGWVELLEWMIEEQGMGEIEDPDYTDIIDYLADHYGLDRPNFPS